MRASRLVSVMLLLQTRGQLTAQQLAAELEVSERTIYRDIGALIVAGVPIRSITGPVGGYRLIDGYRTRLTGLTAAEAESLFLAGVPDAAADLGLVGVLSAAQLKLLAALPPGHRDRAARVGERFLFDAPGWYQDADLTPHLAAVTDAVWHQYRLAIRYRRWAAPTEVDRIVEPFGVVLKAGRWYLVGRVDGALRTFRVSRILRLSTMAETFERPADFVLADHWRSYLDDLTSRLRGGRAVIRLSAAGLDQLPDLVDPVVARAVQDTAEAPETDGWVRAVIPIENAQHASKELLPLGAEVEVLEPLELRTIMAAVAAAMVTNYAFPRQDLTGRDLLRNTVITNQGDHRRHANHDDHQGIDHSASG